METVTLPEQYSAQIKTIGGYPIRVTSYRLWDTFYAKTEVALDGMGGWFARAEGSTQAGAEASVIAEAEWLLAKRRIAQGTAAGVTGPPWDVTDLATGR
jgi:hypothetical protein